MLLPCKLGAEGATGLHQSAVATTKARMASWPSASGLLAVCRAGIWTMQGFPLWHWPMRDIALASHLSSRAARAAGPC